VPLKNPDLGMFVGWEKGQAWVFKIEEMKAVGLKFKNKIILLLFNSNA